MGVPKVAAISYFALALGVGFGHYAGAPKSQYPIGTSLGVGLSWPWLVIELVIEEA